MSDIEEIRERKREELLSGEDPTDDRARAPAEPFRVTGREELSEAVERFDVVLADFYADWCGPCKMIEPIVESIAADTDAGVAKVDVDANQRLASEYGVRGVPTLVLFVGGEPAERFVGVQDEAALWSAVESHT
jgi:thioredoxin 1